MANLQEQIQAITQACQDKKASDIDVLPVGKMTSLTEHFVLASGNSTAQVDAIADAVIEKMEDLGIEPSHRQGQREARWIVLDFGDVIVHIFHREERDYYGLERLWKKDQEDDHEED